MLAVSIDPPDSGEVMLDPPGGIYAVGTTVMISAVPFTGFAFEAFTNGAGSIIIEEPSFAVTLLENTTIVARFTADGAQPSTFRLDIEVSPAGAGSVSLNPPGGRYAPGTNVTLTATPNDGYAFVQYSGDAAGEDPVTVVTVSTNKNVLAEFEWVPSPGNPGNLLVTGFLGANVREFDRFDAADLGEFVAAGTGGISFAGGIDIGPAGDVFVVDVGILSDTRVMRFDGATGAFLGEFVSGAGATGFLTLRFGPNGNLFVPNSIDDSIVEYDGKTGGFVGTLVASGSGGLSNPVGLTFGPNGNLFVVSEDTDSILEFNGTSGAFVQTVVDLSDAGLSTPVDLTFGPDGALYVTISSDESVARVDVEAGTAAAFVEAGAGGLDSPAGLLFHPDTEKLLVVSQGTNQVLGYGATAGNFLGVFAEGTEGDSLFFMALRPGSP